MGASLLDGLVSGIVGGLLAIAGVWLALRHDRQAAEFDRVYAAGVQLMSTLSEMANLFRERDEAAVVRIWPVFLSHHTALQALATRRWPRFALEVARAVADMQAAAHAPTPEAFWALREEAALQLNAAVLAWFNAPETSEADTPVDGLWSRLDVWDSPR